MDVERARAWIRSARRGVVFSGAGLSVESGIPAFRTGDGLWERFDPQTFGSLAGLRGLLASDPMRVLAFLRDALAAFAQAAPHSGHHALAELQRRGHLSGVITQNIDDLHERAGHSEVVKLHGDLARLACIECGCRAPAPDGALERAAALLSLLGSFEENLAQLVALTGRCECGGLRRPDVVLFGELLPERSWAEAQALVAAADLMLVVGASCEVYPAADLPRLAHANGARIVEVNPVPTLPYAHATLPAAAAELLPALLY